MNKQEAMKTTFRKMLIETNIGSLKSLPVEVDVNLDNVLFARHPIDQRFVILQFVDGSTMHVTALSYQRAMKGE